jgi:hypothetical protein
MLIRFLMPDGCTISTGQGRYTLPGVYRLLMTNPLRSRQQGPWLRIR